MLHNTQMFAAECPGEAVAINLVSNVDDEHIAPINVNALPTNEVSWAEELVISVPVFLGHLARGQQSRRAAPPLILLHLDDLHLIRLQVVFDQETASLAVLVLFVPLTEKLQERVIVVLEELLASGVYNDTIDVNTFLQYQGF